jgi:hypothetical protein
MTPPPRKPAPAFPDQWVSGRQPRRTPGPARPKPGDSAPKHPGKARPGPDETPPPPPIVTAEWREVAGATLARLASTPENVVAVSIMIFATAIYLFTSSREATNFDYFVRLADAFNHGRIYLTEAPSWLNELIPKDGHWYVAYPPMPAVVLMPFVALFGTGFHQQIVACLAGGISVGLIWLVLGQFSLAPRARWMLTAVFGFGTVLWFCSETGSAWLISQSVAVMFATAALLPALKHRWPFVSGLLLGCATVSRLPVGLMAPFYLAFLLELDWPPRIPVDRWKALSVISLFIMGALIPGTLYAAYNLARYGTPIDQGYVLIPGVLEDRIYRDHGILSIYYIPRELYAIFFRSWNFSEQYPYLKPSWYGLSLFLTTPLFLWLAKANVHDKRVVYASIGVGLALIPIVTHGNVGLTQFGYRFSLDFQPLLFVILATVFERGVSRLAWTAAILAILTNAYGVWVIGWGFVSF